MNLTKEYLDRLISDQIEESGGLEYKAARSLDRSNSSKTEITKDVSAFANSAGGVVIYGIAEYAVPGKKHLPERYDPVNQTAFSREWLDQIIGQIQPRIDALQIAPIHVGPSETDYCYAVEIPQSSTAHQALDLKYYKRRNFESTPMEDYEIRDVMNRRKHPTITVAMRITDGRPHHEPLLLARVTNTSTVLAKYFRLEMRVPVKIRNRYVQFEDSSLGTTDAGESFWSVIMGHQLGRPLFPKCSVVRNAKFTFVSLITNPATNEPLASIDSIGITVHADEMEPLILTKELTRAEVDWV